MADKSSQLILDALGRAAAGGAPLHGGKTSPGLFPATAAGKQAAVRCREEGYLAPLEAPAPESNGRRNRPAAEAWGLSEKGLAYFLGQVSPRQVLNDLVRALENRAAQLDDLVAGAHQVHDQLATLRTNAEIALRQLVPFDAIAGPNGGLNALFQDFLSKRTTGAHHPEETAARDAHLDDKAPIDSCCAAVIQHLTHWQASGAVEDCPLPGLYRQVSQKTADLSIGQFHDALRRLHDERRIYLHPWTGPLYVMPEPPYAMLIGHEVAYYASLRPEDSGLRNGD